MKTVLIGTGIVGTAGIVGTGLHIYNNVETTFKTPKLTDLQVRFSGIELPIEISIINNSMVNINNVRFEGKLYTGTFDMLGRVSTTAKIDIPKDSTAVTTVITKIPLSELVEDLGQVLQGDLEQYENVEVRGWLKIGWFIRIPIRQKLF